MQHKCSCVTKTQKITPKIDLNKRVKLNRRFFIAIISLVSLHGRPFLKSSGTLAQEISSLSMLLQKFVQF